MPKPDEQLKDVVHRLNQIKPAELDEFIKTVTERADKSDPKIAQALNLAKQLKEQSRGLDLKPPGPMPSAGAGRLAPEDYLVIILLILLFP